jgi:cardiolipin synthase
MVRESFVGGNVVRLLRDGRVAFPDMLEAIAAARDHVWLEMYWFGSDRIGKEFFAVLEQAARRGVSVRVLYDAFGSLATDARYFRDLRAAGAEVVAWNPVSPFERHFGLSKLTLRDHRKLLIADQCAFVGGLNLADQWLPREQGGQDWRDDIVSVQGPVLEQLRRSFELMFTAAGGTPSAAFPAPDKPIGDVRAAALAQTRFRQRRHALRTYLLRLDRARRQVFISNAYFVPNRRIVRSLIHAARRGCDVRVMLPAKSDIELVRLASKAAWSRLLLGGVRIFQFEPRILHSKSAVVDELWTTVGSFNLDYISVFNNAELNLSILDRPFAKVMVDSFLEDQAQCTEVRWSAFKNRPITERVLSRSLHWFRHWL